MKGSMLHIGGIHKEIDYLLILITKIYIDKGFNPTVASSKANHILSMKIHDLLMDRALAFTGLIKEPKSFLSKEALDEFSHRTMIANGYNLISYDTATKRMS